MLPRIGERPISEHRLDGGHQKLMASEFGEARQRMAWRDVDDLPLLTSRWVLKRIRDR